MAIITLLPSTSQLLARATVTTAQYYGTIQGMGDLRPIPMAAFTLDEYRMQAGWPVSVPDCDVLAHSLISCDGEIIGNRPDASEVDTAALVRWIADQDTTYDGASWYPYVGEFDTKWATGDPYAPVYLSDYEYRVGDERLFSNALNFDSDSQQHMWANLDPVIGGGYGYTVIMAVNLHSVYGDTDHAFTGLWCPGLPTPLSDTFTEDQLNWVSVQLRGEYLYVGTEQTPFTKSVPVADLLALSQPIYLAFCFGRPYIRVYAGMGPSRLRTAQTFSGTTPTGLSGKVVLGRSTGDILHTADLAILDIGIYADQLSAAQVNAEVAKLSAIYGGDK